MTLTPYSLLIDERGEPTTVEQLGRRFGSSRPTDAIIKYAVGQMGGIALAERDRVLVATFDAVVVTHLALTHLIQRFGEQPGSRLAIRDFGGDEHVRLLPSRHAATSLLSDLMNRRGQQNRYWRARTVTAMTPFAGKIEPARVLLEDRSFDEASLRALERLMPGVCTINWLDESSGHYRMQNMSDLMRAFDRPFFEGGKGKTYFEFHDKAYGAWVAQSFADQDRDEGPVTESVDAMTSPFGAAERRVSYQRLMLPFTRNRLSGLFVATDVRSL